MRVGPLTHSLPRRCRRAPGARATTRLTFPVLWHAVRLVVIGLVVATLVGGCVPYRTQASDFAQERWHVCQRRFPAARLTGIGADGLISFYGIDGAASSGIEQCLQEVAERQALRVLAPKPPRAVFALPPAEERRGGAGRIGGPQSP